MKKTKSIRLLILSLGLLLAGCAQEEEPATNTGSQIATPIAFDCWAGAYRTNDNNTDTRAANGYTGNITAENKQLRYAGFGMFMAHDNTSKPDIMYNQEVEYVFLADGSDDGYWTYSPQKYWPAQAVGVCFYAYAPYVPNPESIPAGTTGIINISSNADANPTIVYARTKHPEENVDLLWYFHEVAAEDAFLSGDDHRPSMHKAVPLQMQHALARVKLNLGITNGTSLADGEKLLVKRITLKGNFAKTGTLHLNSTGPAPTWTDQVLADKDAAANEDNTIIIDCDPETTASTAPSLPSYGIIDEMARYLKELPTRWQPDGLPHVNYDDTNEETKAATSTNLLCMGDAISYLYLIPQASLTFTCVLDYCIISADGSTLTDYHKTTDVGDTPIVITPLTGNKTYDLTLKITIS